MKKLTIKDIVGCFLLLTIGILVVRGNKANVRPEATRLYITCSGACVSITGAFEGVPNTTIGGIGQQAVINTTASTFHKVFATSECNASSAVHIHC